ncbi:MAG: sodium:proton antiporter [Actinobacteria bacterium]|nr:sodium:proton antiporter [Actinomycetota bacterium]
MTSRGRRGLFLTGAAGLALLLLWGTAGLPDFGDYQHLYGLTLNAESVAATRATNAVAAVTFDYRGFDTLGEEFILFAAVLGTALLLRAQREEEEEPPEDMAPDRRPPHDSDAVRELCLGLVAPIFLFGVYIVVHGHLSPGGGFQGGVVLATAPLLMYIGGEYRGLRTVTPEAPLELVKGAGTGGYVLIGLSGLWFGTSFLDNALPRGNAGDVISSGTILALNLAVGMAVAGGLVLLLTEFLEQTLVLRSRSRK